MSFMAVDDDSGPPEIMIEILSAETAYVNLVYISLRKEFLYNGGVNLKE
ncbi:MAG: hypothetical protein QXO20_04720 [Candidatus Bathyarchaeia archaeon]